jgi:hypothetical protein
VEWNVVRAQLPIAEKQKLIVDKFAWRKELLVANRGRRPKFLDQWAVFFKSVQDLDKLKASQAHRPRWHEDPRRYLLRVLAPTERSPLFP